MSLKEGSFEECLTRTNTHRCYKLSVGDPPDTLSTASAQELWKSTHDASAVCYNTAGGYDNIGGTPMVFGRTRPSVDYDNATTTTTILGFENDAYTASSQPSGSSLYIDGAPEVSHSARGSSDQSYQNMETHRT